ncbi:uncharacterized protein LOC131997006 [Stomoxys calcitrans]|uniref:uncharacterized protein LOC131997006 n=1 Tax=Stomoxys calcitrans TaxID=35570 RepID=UPI0027E3A799|nr:uncharacterized protein LOC131997006 [Stomoxys calcitrans]
MFSILIFALLVNFNQIIHINAQCRRYEIYYNSSLSPTCDVNCQDLQRPCRLTTQSPQPGCYCQANYARNLRQQCIPRSECSRDCFPNESPIAPLSRSCERICRLRPNTMPISICYRQSERLCVCDAAYCRNRNGQCQRGN